MRLLDHALPLLVVGHTFAVGLCGYIVFVRSPPKGGTDDLLDMDPVGKGDEVIESSVDRCKATAHDPNPLPGASGLLGLMVATSM